MRTPVARGKHHALHLVGPEVRDAHEVASAKVFTFPRLDESAPVIFVDSTGPVSFVDDHDMDRLPSALVSSDHPLSSIDNFGSDAHALVGFHALSTEAPDEETKLIERLRNWDRHWHGYRVWLRLGLGFRINRFRVRLRLGLRVNRLWVWLRLGLRINRFRVRFRLGLWCRVDRRRIHRLGFRLRLRFWLRSRTRHNR